MGLGGVAPDIIDMVDDSLFVVGQAESGDQLWMAPMRPNTQPSLMDGPMTDPPTSCASLTVGGSSSAKEAAMSRQRGHS